MSPTRPSMQSRAIVVAAVLSGALVTGGWLVERGMRPGSGGSTVSRARLLEDVMQRVQQNYVDTLNRDELYRKATTGLLYELRDPHTVFLTPDRYRRLSETTSGSYVGLGMQVDVRDGWPTVVAPLPGTPAEQAGIQPGDRI